MSDVPALARCTEKITSSAVNGEPSWNLTFGRSFTRQRVGATCFHSVASTPTSSSDLPRFTSVSYTCPFIWLVSDSFCECGSIVCGSPCDDQRRVCAEAAAASDSTRLPTTNPRRIIRLLQKGTSLGGMGRGSLGGTCMSPAACHPGAGRDLGRRFTERRVS